MTSLLNLVKTTQEVGPDENNAVDKARQPRVFTNEVIFAKFPNSDGNFAYLARVVHS